MYKVGNMLTQKYVQTKEYAYLCIKQTIYILKNIYKRENMYLIRVKTRNIHT